MPNWLRGYTRLKIASQVYVVNGLESQLIDQITYVFVTASQHPAHKTTLLSITQ